MKATIKVEHYEKLARETGAGGNAYKGLQILANRGLHEHVARLLGRLLPTGGNVLELGAGSGALSLRLADLGFNVTAVDYVPDNFKAAHERIRFVRADLNQELPADATSKHDAVLAVEIVEHLENVRQLARGMTQSVKPGGWIAVTTPNICSSKSVVTFLASGRFDLFRPRHYEKDGHINPVPWFVLRDALQECGLERIQISSFKNDALSLKGLLGLILQILFLGWRIPKGKIIVAVARKPAVGGR